MSELTPRRIVALLDEFIIGQADAKKAAAVALRNRWRRKQLTREQQREIYPKNILLIGPTGVGKTELARRLAHLSRAPFLKVEASKFTEVGYVGRDVESMVRDLVELAVRLVRDELFEQVHDVARRMTEERILDAFQEPIPGETSESEPFQDTPREILRQELQAGSLDDQPIWLDLPDSPPLPALQIFGPSGMEEVGMQFSKMLPGMFPARRRRKKILVGDALKRLTQEEASKLVDSDSLIQTALERVQEDGILFIDEIDKIAGPPSKQGPDVSREGVQRDLLPIIEGTTVATKYGMVQTDHILFLAAGAFHVSKPSDLIPELQGRFPIRVSLDELGEEDFARILLEPRNALLAQYSQLLGAEGIELVWEEPAVLEIARLAQEVNRETENIGARRLHTLLEKLLEDISFEAPDLESSQIVIDKAFVEKKLAGIVEDRNLSRFIL